GNDDFPSEVVSIPKVGGFDNVSIEQVVALKPDLVLASNIHISSVVPALRRLGIRVLVVDPQTVNQVLDAIVVVGDSVGRHEVAYALAAKLRKEIEAIRQRTAVMSHPRVFWELSPDLWTAGPGSYIDDLIRIAGGRNVAGNARAPWIQISNESIVAENPQIVILSDQGYGASPETVAARPGWNAVSAVTSHRIVPVANEDVVSRPGPRVLDALLWVARTIHPGDF
ncbi:MAG TPA: helical backbone metal receptor, partial [Spirochaetia bacterium]|nr:helical backbone metal receptor [Spirochaetia bacterium]